MAVAGAVLLRRRGLPRLPLLAWPAIVTAVAALTMGTTRYDSYPEKDASNPGKGLFLVDFGASYPFHIHPYPISGWLSYPFPNKIENIE